MSSHDAGSITRCIVEMKAGDDAAVQTLWHRYFRGLVRLARTRLGRSPRAAADEEDVALSAFHSLCVGAAGNRFPRLDDRDDLGRLLATITARKALDQMGRQRRLKRGGGRVLDESELAGRGGGAGLDGIAGLGPTPEVAAALAEGHSRMFDALRDESLRRVARMRLEGYSVAEVAQRLGCNRRTVTRKLDLIRLTWLEFDLP